MFQKRALIVGVTGIVGFNVAEHLLQTGSWEISGISRRPQVGFSAIEAINVDILDEQATSTALSVVDPTHVFFCTWTKGATEAENIRLNSAMLNNVLAALNGRKLLQHVAMVTGTKHYLGPFEQYGKSSPVTPFREDQPRLPIDNFYYALEDILWAAAKTRGFGWSVHRSHTIIGYALGNLMNMGATLAAYASICRKT